MGNYCAGEFNGGDIDLGTTVQPCSVKGFDSDKDKTPSISIRACLFFDGTLNNRTNVEQGKLGKGSGGSYDNELSNIAILERYWLLDENADLSFSVYVEGIGTTNFKPDSELGAATGMFGTGIIAKVESGIAQIVMNIGTIRCNCYSSPIDFNGLFVLIYILVRYSEMNACVYEYGIDLKRSQVMRYGINVHTPMSLNVS